MGGDRYGAAVACLAPRLAWLAEISALGDRKTSRLIIPRGPGVRALGLCCEVKFIVNQFSADESFQNFGVLNSGGINGIVYELATSNPPIGIFKEQAFDSSRAQFSSGDITVLLTDGLTEVMDSREAEYGLERIKHSLANHSAQPLNVICEMLMLEAREFGKQADDQSVLLVR